MSQPDNSGQFDARKLRSTGIWVPIGLAVSIIAVAVGWGANGIRVSNLEQERVEERQERNRMEEHIENDDKELAVLKDHMLTIIEQLRDLTAEQRDMNSKLDRAEQERGK